MAKRVLLASLSIILLFSFTACHGGGTPDEMPEDKNAMALRVGRGEARPIIAEHPILGGTWIDESTGNSLNFAENGYVDFNTHNTRQRLAYALCEDVVIVCAGKETADIWYYEIDGNNLAFTSWKHGDNAFTRDGGNPPAGGLIGSWQINEMNYDLTFKEDGTLRYSNISGAEYTYSFSLDGDIINVFTNDGAVERWRYIITDGYLIITWPDGTLAPFYHRGEYMEPQVPTIIWSNQGSIVGDTWRDDESGISLTFNADGILDYKQDGAEAMEGRFSYAAYPNRVVSVDIPGGKTQYWCYKFADNNLCVTWSNGTRTFFYRERSKTQGTLPGEAGPNTAGICGCLWVGDADGVFLEFSADGNLHYSKSIPLMEDRDYTYTIDIDTIYVNTGENVTEYWDYRLDGDTLYITWENGDAMTFFRLGQQAPPAEEGGGEAPRVAGTWENGHGNSQGNINNMGLFAASEENLYLSDSDNDYYLVKMRLSSGERKVLLESVVSYINIADGYLVFCNESDNLNLYSMRLDDGSYTVLVESTVKNVSTVNGVVYFIKIDDSYRIYSVSLSGGDLKCLSNAPAGYFCVVNGFIYYHNLEDSLIYRTDLAGSEPLLVSDAVCSEFSCLTVTDEYILFIDSEANIVRLGLDGQDKRIIGPAKAARMNYSNGVIFYTGAEDMRLYSISIDGGESTLQDDRQCYNVHVFGDQLYYYWQ